MTIKLWQYSPRRINSLNQELTDIFGRNDGSQAEPAIATDAYFGTPAAPITSGAFAISGSSAIAFQSITLAGPPSSSVVPAAWLKRDDLRKVILVEIDYSDQTGSGYTAARVLRTKYFANSAYFDDVNGRPYRDCVVDLPRYNRALDRTKLRGRYTSSIGSVGIANQDHKFDDLLTLAVDGCEVRFYIGDGGDIESGRQPWLRSEFIFMFSAIAVKFTAPSLGMISLVLKDTGILLDRIVGGTVAIGGTGVNAEKFRPKNFGYVHNITFPQVDAAALTYTYNESGLNCTLLAVRCRGTSIAYTDNLDGTVRMLADPVGGLITGDVLVTTGGAAVTQLDISAATVGAFRVSDMFYQLVGVDAGLIAMGKFAGASGNFEFTGSNDYHVGRNYATPTKLPEALNEWCDTANAYYAVRRDGYVTYGWLRPEALDIEIPPASWSVGPAITNDSLIKGSEPKIDHADPGFYSVQGFANINWTAPQNDLALGLSETVAELYRRKGYYTSPDVGAGSGSTTAYSGPSDSPGYGVFKYGNPQLYHLTLKKSLDNSTLISCATDADAAVHLTRWQFVNREQQLPNLEFLDVAVDLSYYSVELGNILPVTITEADGSTRYGFSATRMQVVSVDIALTDQVVRLGLVRRRPAILDVYNSSASTVFSDSVAETVSAVDTASTTAALACGGTITGMQVIELLFEDASSTGPYLNTAAIGPASFTRTVPDGTVGLDASVFYDGAQSLKLTGPTDGHEGAFSAFDTALEIGSSDFLIRVRVRFVAVTPSTYGNFLIDFDSRYGGTGAGRAPRLATNAAGTAFVFHNAASGGSNLSITGGTPLLNTWQTVEVARVSGVTHLCVDGIEIGAIADTTVYTQAGSYGVQIGRAGSTAGNVINGYIDHVEFYNGAVTDVTFDPGTNKGTGATLSGGNLTASMTNSGTGSAANSTTAYSTGKHYAEFLINSIDGLNHQPSIGMWQKGGTGGNQAGPGQNAGTGSGWFINSGGTVGNKGLLYSTVAGFSATDIIQVAADMSTGNVWIGKNNVWYFSGNPSTGANPQTILDAGILYCASACSPAATTTGVTAHFSLASFTYTPPTGFIPW